MFSKSEEDTQALQQSNEMAALSLNDRVEDLMSQQKYFEKLSTQHEEDYRRTLAKLTVCYDTLSATTTNNTGAAGRRRKGSGKGVKTKRRMGSRKIDATENNRSVSDLTQPLNKI